MSLWDRLRGQPPLLPPQNRKPAKVYGDTSQMPTVQFYFDKDMRRAVLADLDRHFSALEVDPRYKRFMMTEAMSAVQVGGDLGSLISALQRIPGMSRAEARRLGISINSRATAIIVQVRQSKAGIVFATWRYSGAPCVLNPRRATADEWAQDAAHKAASGTRYPVREGLFVNGRWTYPGREEGCKCISVPVMPWEAVEP